MISIFRVLFCCSLLFMSIFCVKKREGEQKTGMFSQLLKISDNEDKGIKAVLTAYGGYCEYLLGKSVDSKDGNDKYFKLKLSKSDLVENYKSHPKILASGIAYTFYSNLVEEKNNYTEIHSVLIFNDGNEVTYEYPASTLEKVYQKMNIVDSVVQAIKSKDFNNLKPILDNQSIFKYDKDELIRSLKKIDLEFGNVKSFIVHGFKIDKLENGMELLHVMGVLKRDIRNHEFRMDLDINSKSNQAFMVDYKFDYSDLSGSK